MVKKRESSVGNAGNAVKSPKKAKLVGNVAKTPNKSPGKNDKGSVKKEKTPQINKSPKATPEKTPKIKVEESKTPKVKSEESKTAKVAPVHIKTQTPVLSNGTKTPKSELDSSSKKSKKNKRSSESENDVKPPKKLQKFAGTSGLSDAKEKTVKNINVKKESNEKNVKVVSKEGKIKRKGQFFNLQQQIKEGDKEALKKLELRIQQISGRKELTKTAKRKLKLLNKFKVIIENGGELPAVSTNSKSTSQKRKETRKNTKPTQQEETKTVKPKQEKKPVQIKKEEDDEESSEESDYDVEKAINPGKIVKIEPKEDEEGVDEVDSDDDEEEEESEDGEEESADEEKSEDGEEESEDDEEGEEEESEDDEEEQPTKKPQPKQKKEVSLKDLKENNIVEKNKKRFVLFAGNLPFDATKEDITAHFKKVGVVKDVRIPTDKKSNRPRGFAYVEVENEEAYQKGLSLHHTFIKGRRINVLYSEGGKKQGEEKKKAVKAKNFKLHAMRKQGILTGSVNGNQKRAARRAKQNKKEA